MQQGERNQRKKTNRLQKREEKESKDGCGEKRKKRMCEKNIPNVEKRLQERNTEQTRMDIV